MFTGLVQGCIKVIDITVNRLVLPLFESDSFFQIGESIAVNGVCLTAVEVTDHLIFDVSEETFARTCLSNLKPGDHVNVERAMRPVDRFGGHIVQGHVDATGILKTAVEQAGSWLFSFVVEPDFDRYLIDKGSITLNGISLTVIAPKNGEFQVAIIPHTLTSTNLMYTQAGDQINVEFDVLAKHVEKLLSARL